MRHLEFVIYKYFRRLTLGRSFKFIWNFWSGGLRGNIFACGAVTKFGIFKYKRKYVRNKRKYVRPSRLMRIDAFDSILSAIFVAILLSPNFARRRASNLCVLHNTLYIEWYSGGQTRWNGLKIGECVLNNVVNKFVYQYCDLICI